LSRISKIINLILYISHKLTIKQFLSEGPGNILYDYRNVILRLETDPNLPLLLGPQYKSVFSELIDKGKDLLPIEHRLPLQMMPKDAFKKRWNLTCSNLSFLDSRSIDVVLRSYIMNVRALEKENYEFEYQNLEGCWAMDLFVFPGIGLYPQNMIIRLLTSLGLTTPIKEKVETPALVADAVKKFFNSEILYTSYGSIFVHIHFILVLLIMLKNKSEKGDIWKQSFGDLIALLRDKGLDIDNNISYACVNLGEDELLAILNQ